MADQKGVVRLYLKDRLDPSFGKELEARMKELKAMVTEMVAEFQKIPAGLTNLARDVAKAMDITKKDAKGAVTAVENLEVAVEGAGAEATEFTDKLSKMASRLEEIRQAFRGSVNEAKTSTDVQGNLQKVYVATARSLTVLQEELQDLRRETRSTSLSSEELAGNEQMLDKVTAQLVATFRGVKAATKDVFSNAFRSDLDRITDSMKKHELELKALTTQYRAGELSFDQLSSRYREASGVMERYAAELEQLKNQTKASGTANEEKRRTIIAIEAAYQKAAASVKRFQDEAKRTDLNSLNFQGIQSILANSVSTFEKARVNFAAMTKEFRDGKVSIDAYQLAIDGLSREERNLATAIQDVQQRIPNANMTTEQAVAVNKRLADAMGVATGATRLLGQSLKEIAVARGLEGLQTKADDVKVSFSKLQQDAEALSASFKRGDITVEQYKQSLTTLETKAREANQQFRIYASGMDATVKSTSGAKTAMVGVANSLETMKVQFQGSRREILEYEKAMQAASVENQRFTRLITLMTMSNLANVGTFGRMVSSAAQVTAAFQSYGAAAAGIVAGLSAVAGVLVGVQAAFKALGSVVSYTLGQITGNYAQFEQQIVTASAVMTGSLNNVASLSNLAKTVALDFVASSQEVAAGLVMLGQSGFSATESMTSIRSIAELAQATMSDFKSAVDLTTTSMRAYEDQNVTAAQVANTLVAGITNSKLTIESLRTSFNYVAVSASEANVSIEETVALLGTMADRGIRASTQATGLRGILGSMLAPTAAFRHELEKVGLSMADIDVRTLGMSKVLHRLRDAGFDVENAYASLDKRIAAAATTLIENVDHFDELTKRVTGTADAAVIAGLQMDTLSGKMKIIANVFENLGLVIGEQAEGAMKDFLDTVLRILPQLEPFAKALGDLATIILGHLSSAFSLFEQKGFALIDVVNSFVNAILQVFEPVLNMARGFVFAAEASGRLQLAIAQVAGASDETVAKLRDQVDMLSRMQGAMTAAATGTVDLRDVFSQLGVTADKVRNDTEKLSGTYQDYADKLTDLKSQIQDFVRVSTDDNRSILERAKAHERMIDLLQKNADVTAKLSSQVLESATSTEVSAKALDDLVGNLEKLEVAAQSDAAAMQMKELSTSTFTAAQQVDHYRQAREKMIASSSDGLATLEAENIVYQERTIKMAELEAQMVRNAAQDAVALNNMAQSQDGFANLDMALESLVESLDLKDIAAAQASATILGLAMNMEHGSVIAERLSTESLAQLNFALTVFGQRSASAGTSLVEMSASVAQSTATLATYRNLIIPTVAQLDAAQSALTESVNALLLAGSANINMADITTKQGAAMAATLEDIAVKYQSNTTAMEEYKSRMEELRQSYADGAISVEEYSARASAAESALAEARRQSTQQMQAEVIDAYTNRMQEIERAIGTAVHVENYYVEEVRAGLDAINAKDSELAAARIQNAENVRAVLSQTSKSLVEEYLAAAEQQRAALGSMISNLEGMISTLSKVQESAGGAAASLRVLITQGISAVNNVMSEGGGEANKYVESLNRLRAITANLSAQQSSLSSDLSDLNDRYQNGQISASEYAQGLDALKSRYSQVTQSIQEGNSIAQEFAKTKDEEARAAMRGNNALNRYGITLSQTSDLERNFDRASRSAAQGKQKATEDLIKYRETLNATDESIRKITDAMSKLKEKTEELASSTKSELFKDAGLDSARDKLNAMALKMSEIKSQGASGIDLKLNADAAIATGTRVRDELSAPIYTDWIVTKKVVGDDGGEAPSGHRWGGRIGESRTYGGGDKVPALLEKGEFVIRKEMVRRFGEGFFHGINRRGVIPKFASGGLVGGIGGGDYSTRIRELEELFEQLGWAKYTKGYEEVALDSPEGAASAAQSAKSKESILSSLKGVENKSTVTRQLQSILGVLKDALVQHRISAGISGSVMNELTQRAEIPLTSELNARQYETLFGYMRGSNSEIEKILEGREKARVDFIAKFNSKEPVAAFSRSQNPSVSRGTGRGSGMLNVESPAGGSASGAPSSGGGRDIDFEELMVNAARPFYSNEDSSQGGQGYTGVLDPSYYKKKYGYILKTSGFNGLIDQFDDVKREANYYRDMGSSPFVTNVPDPMTPYVDMVNFILRRFQSEIVSAGGPDMSSPVIGPDALSAEQLSEQIEQYFERLKKKMETRMQEGGYVDSPLKGFDVPALLEKGEFVINKHAVRALTRNYGSGILEKLNNMSSMMAKLPKFHAGGIVGDSVAASAGTAGSGAEDFGGSTTIRFEVRSHAPEEVDSLIRNRIIPGIDKARRRRSG